MKIIESINNNFARAIDGQGNMLIVAGKGVGFGKLPKTINDYSIIDRTYYDVEEVYISMIKDIPEEVILISGSIVDKARNTIENPINSNIVFTLADHINFCIQRHKKSMDLKLPIINDIEHLFRKEMEVGKFGVRLINKNMNLNLPNTEAAYIALHLINAEEDQKKTEAADYVLIDKIVSTIEKCYDIKIDRSHFNYSRFVTHIHYLLKRGKSNQFMKTENSKLYEVIKNEYEKSFKCSEIISNYLKENFDLILNEEEKLYLMLHINRLCDREEFSDQK